MYGATEKLLALCNVSPSQIGIKGEEVRNFVESRGLKRVAESIGVGEPTLADIVENILKPGRDPREDLPASLLRDDVLKIEDLKAAMNILDKALKVYPGRTIYIDFNKVRQ